LVQGEKNGAKDALGPKERSECQDNWGGGKKEKNLFKHQRKNKNKECAQKDHESTQIPARKVLKGEDKAKINRQIGTKGRKRGRSLSLGKLGLGGEQKEKTPWLTNWG